MIQKIIYILLVTAFQIPFNYGQPTWEKIKTPTDFNLLKVFYLDSLHCWAAGDSGVIMFSGDQGKSWQLQNSGVSNYISDLFFLNDSLGWAVTFELENFNIRSKILKTTNGGNNWDRFNYRHLNIILTTIFFQDSLHGWIGGEPFDLSFSEDGGLNWNPANVDTGAFSNFPVNKLKFSSAQYGFAVGGAIDVAGVVWRTSNAGQFWKAYGIAPDKFDDFIFVDSLTALSLSADRERYYPIGVLAFDISQSKFIYDELDKYGRVTGVAKRTESEFWCSLGCDTSFIISKDMGKTWEFFPTKDSICFNSIAFSDSNHGIVVANSGYIFRYIPESPVAVENITQFIPANFALEQNYPNPFNPSTKIRWKSPVSGWQTLKVYDVLGNEIAVLVDEYKPAGNYEVNFVVGQDSGPEIASGIYFYQVKIESYIETKKMLLLK
ncbi:MAG TPA: hypothetical protein DHV28_06510 [Ignavibacteriales bacterium]|nr:hypothetical protein [Ignavibacteriales bacterium]